MESGKSFTKKWISYCTFYSNKKCFPLHVRKFFFTDPYACNLQPTVSNFAVHAPRFSVMLVQAASHVAFPGYFESTCTKQYSTKFFLS